MKEAPIKQHISGNNIFFLPINLSIMLHIFLNFKKIACFYNILHWILHPSHYLSTVLGN